MDALRRSGGTPNQGCFLAILMALCKKNRMTEAEWTVQETADILDGCMAVPEGFGKNRAVTRCNLEKTHPEASVSMKER